MAKREPITLTDNPLATSAAPPSPLPPWSAASERPASDVKSAAGEKPQPRAKRVAAGAGQGRRRSTRRPNATTARTEAAARPEVEADDPGARPARPGPSLDEALTTVFARVPESIALAFERLTLAVRQTERQPSQKALPAQELLGALLWRYGNGDEPEVVRDMIELLREYRAARYAASIKRIETRPAA